MFSKTRKTTKKTGARKAGTKRKRGLGRTVTPKVTMVCVKKLPNGGWSTVSAINGGSCPVGYKPASVQDGQPVLNGARKAAAKKKRVSAKKLCAKVIRVEGINSKTGQLKKGYKYKGGKPVRVTPKK